MLLWLFLNMMFCLVSTDIDKDSIITSPSDLPADVDTDLLPVGINQTQKSDDDEEQRRKKKTLKSQPGV